MKIFDSEVRGTNKGMEGMESKKKYRKKNNTQLCGEWTVLPKHPPHTGTASSKIGALDQGEEKEKGGLYVYNVNVTTRYSRKENKKWERTYSGPKLAETTISYTQKIPPAIPHPKHSKKKERGGIVLSLATAKGRKAGGKTW